MARRKTLTKEQYKKNQLEAGKKWRAKNTIIFNIRLNLIKDEKIIKFIQKQKNKSKFIKEIILEKIKKE